ncbi:MAG: hypothetical protein Q7U35_05770 [Methanobacteriaceae archaeon]|nr:hypothetical protein [Methanobacteriaceae archaeon]MDP2835825.1 hypothetical protein [Methanobacteriaceae archaeon]MDP3034628.1 hypothetical protein [Methanobacteriaceae archaeon]MDP3623283.1 hypothetical protein [Methanobacteriaceae archaeon]
MIYKKYLAMIMVLGLMSFEPTAAMQIGSENELYSDINSNNVFEGINKTKITCELDKISGNDVHGRNDRFLNMNSVKIKSFKKFSKTPHIQLIQRFKHSLIIKKTNVSADENIHKNKSESNKNHLSNVSQQVSNNKTNIDEFHSEANINKTQNSNIIENKTKSTEFALNKQSINNNSAGISNFTNRANETPEINNTTNGTLNSTENNTNLNNTQNLTNNTTVSLNAEESTKDKVCDTLLAVGYLSAAIAAGCALNPEPFASKVIGAIAVGVAVVSFVAYICIKWIW